MSIVTLAREEKPIVAYWKVLGWSPEKWGEFVDEEKGRREKILPDTGPLSISRNWSITVIELAHLRLEAGFEKDDQSRKDALADRFQMAAEIAADYTLEKLCDPQQMAEADFTDVAKVARQMSDAALNIKNGSTEAPNRLSMNWDDIKKLVQLGKELAEPYKPVEIPVEGRVIDA